VAAPPRPQRLDPAAVANPWPPQVAPGPAPRHFLVQRPSPGTKCRPATCRGRPTAKTEGGGAATGTFWAFSGPASAVAPPPTKCFRGCFCAGCPARSPRFAAPWRSSGGGGAGPFLSAVTGHCHAIPQPFRAFFRQALLGSPFHSSFRASGSVLSDVGQTCYLWSAGGSGVINNWPRSMCHSGMPPPELGRAASVHESAGPRCV